MQIPRFLWPFYAEFTGTASLRSCAQISMLPSADHNNYWPKQTFVPLKHTPMVSLLWILLTSPGPLNVRYHSYRCPWHQWPAEDPRDALPGAGEPRGLHQRPPVRLAREVRRTPAHPPQSPEHHVADDRTHPVREGRRHGQDRQPAAGDATGRWVVNNHIVYLKCGSTNLY